MEYHIVNVTRKAYVESIGEITDSRSRGFAEMALQWWDRHYSWRAGGSVILVDEAGRHLCYLFYKIDRYKEYLTIHNILTPLCHRRQGYALLLLHWVFERALHEHVGRFQATCVPQSLAFYLSLGFTYWGLTTTRDYYCNLPIPVGGLEGLKQMVNDTSAQTLAGSALQTIHTKVADNAQGLDAEQQRIHNAGMSVLQGNYMHGDLMQCIDEAAEDSQGGKG